MFDLNGKRKAPAAVKRTEAGADPIGEKKDLEQDKYSMEDKTLSREFVQAELVKLPMDKQVGYCLWKIGDLAGREVELTVEDYRPDMAMWSALDTQTKAQLLKELKEEMFAMMLLEKKNGKARWALTMRDKLLLYIEAVNHISGMNAEVLDRPCTWADFKKLVARMVAMGRDDTDGND